MLQMNRWGRNGETASEDPWFNGLYYSSDTSFTPDSRPVCDTFVPRSRYGAAYSEGAQHDPDEPGYIKTIVTLKHWGAYSVDLYKNASGEWFRQSFGAFPPVFSL